MKQQINLSLSFSISVSMFTSVHAKYKRLLQKLVLNWSNKAFCPKGYTAFILFIIHEAVWGFSVSSILFYVICRLYFLILSTCTIGMIAILGKIATWKKHAQEESESLDYFFGSYQMAAVLTRLSILFLAELRLNIYNHFLGLVL